MLSVKATISAMLQPLSSIAEGTTRRAAFKAGMMHR